MLTGGLEGCGPWRLIANACLGPKKGFKRPKIKNQVRLAGPGCARNRLCAVKKRENSEFGAPRALARFLNTVKTGGKCSALVLPLSLGEFNCVQTCVFKAV